MNDRATRVRVVGPLARYADGFAAVLAQRGYAPSSAAGQLQLMAHVSRWLVQRGLAGDDLTPTVVEQFLQTRRAAGYGQWLSVRGMAPLLAYLRRVGIAPVPPPVLAKTPVETLLAAYRVFLVEERGLAASTAGSYLCVAQQFVSHCGVLDHGDLSGLSAVQVSEFVLANCQEPNAGSATNLVVGLRALLRYLSWSAGITATGLAGAVPSAASWPATTLPAPISPGDARRLLHACDRRTTVGRRDFAVLTLMLRLGLRVSEVAALELGDVDWRHGEILVRGKGCRQERLPLPADVGEAVAGWLHRGRPQSSCTRVFTTLLAPDGALTGKAVSAIVARAAGRCRVQASAHRLRHTAASDLLRAGASLPEVGQVLRQTSILNTARYAKIDHAKLAAVALPWPGGAR
jgi:integrase/recombinase XerD